MAFHLPTTANHGGGEDDPPASPPAAAGEGILDGGGVNVNGVPTLNVDMSLRPHRPGSAAAGRGGAGGPPSRQLGRRAESDAPPAAAPSCR